MKQFFKIILFLTIGTSAHNVNSQGVNKTFKTQTDSIDGFLRKRMNESGIVGLSAAVIVDKKIIWSNGYGYADNETKKPFTINTIMNIGSTAKNFRAFV
jgi:CubicO group peptidase (beta-lactamase class C family)